MAPPRGPAGTAAGRAPEERWALPLALLALLVALVPLPGDAAATTWSATGLVPLGAGLGVLVLLCFRPRWAPAALVLFVFTDVSRILVTRHHLPSLLRALVVLLIVLAWRRHGAAGWARVARGGLALLLVAYSLLLLVSTVFAERADLAQARFLEVAKATVLALLLAVLAQTARGLRSAGRALVAGAAGLGGLGVYQVATGRFADDFGGFARVKLAHIYGELFEPRIAGPVGDPNFFAQALLAVVPIAVFFAWREERRLPRALAAAAAALTLAAAVFTYSRGAWLALACELALVVALSSQRLRLGALAAAFVAGFLLLAPQEFTRRLTTVVQLVSPEEAAVDPDSSFEERRLYTQTAWTMFLARPLVGVGAGNYTVHFAEHADRVGSAGRSYEAPGAAHYPHNLYLEIAAETGLVGATSFAAVLVAAFAALERARRRLERRGDARAAGLARAVTVGLAGYLVSSLFLHGHFLRYLWLLLGFALALEAHSRRAPEGDATRA